MPAPGAAQPVPAPVAGAESYVVFVAGRTVGREELAVIRQADGWVVRGSSLVNPPLGLIVRHVELRYDGAWNPRSMSLDGAVQGRDVALETTFADGKATNRLKEGGESTEKVDDVAADAVVLSNIFFGSYAALAARLAPLAAGAELRAYVAPQAEIPVAVTAVTEERIETPRRTFTVRRYAVTFKNPGAEVAATLWADTSGAFVRLSVPSQSLEIARDDVASAASRMSAFSIEGDESVRIGANGFNLAATFTRPKDGRGPLPAVVLIGGAGPADRDGTVAGIPMMGQIARDLVAAGFAVVRFDKRGVGQSGGRAETAALADYADDARAVVTWLRKTRKDDVDGRRIAVLGHSEGAWVALRLAAIERDIAALVLVAGSSGTGGALVLEQQQRLLADMQVAEDERKAKAELQTRINLAATGAGPWDDVPKELRAQAETAWFASYLAFDPAAALKDVRQPILIVQGERDTQVAPRHAEALAALARARKRQAAVDVVLVPGVNHLLVPAATGAVAEYASLGDTAVSPEATGAIAKWLAATLPPPRR
jgi:pimeloyl-ACP methyl ester carboxylesterase